MATGSRRYFRYTADNDDAYAVELDESTYETVALGFSGSAAGLPVIAASASRPLKMRYVNAFRVVGEQTIRAKFYVGSLTALNALIDAGVVTVETVAWSLSSPKGESRKIVPQTDSEQLDGDVDTN